MSDEKQDPNLLEATPAISNGHHQPPDATPDVPEMPSDDAPTPSGASPATEPPATSPDNEPDVSEAQQEPESAYDPEQDYALISAWRRLLDFDRLSTRQKNESRQVRAMVISLSLLTSAVAALMTYLGGLFTLLDEAFRFLLVFLLVAGSVTAMVLWPRFVNFWAFLRDRGPLRLNNLGEFVSRVFSLALIEVPLAVIVILAIWGYSNFNWPPLESSFRVLLVAMPIVSILLMEYAAQYASGTAWIDYRVNAEAIRQEIYRYRARSGAYRLETLSERQDQLLKRIIDINQDASLTNVPYIRLETLDHQIHREIDSKANIMDDNGLSHLADPDDYIRYRLEHQLHWYVSKVQIDFNTARRYRIAALGIAGMGSILVVLSVEFAALVAITTAMGIALNQRKDLQMFGMTYAIYHDAAIQLQDALAEWRIQPVKDADAYDAFVQKVEAIFQREMQGWRTQAKQVLKANDESILDQVNRQLDGRNGQNGSTSQTQPSVPADPEGPDAAPTDAPTDAPSTSKDTGTTTTH